jgi:glycosyltransferase involved in cell wall biosynthesis
MRVAFVSPFLFRFLRGVERFTVDLANSLAERGVEVHLITWRERKDWPWCDLQPGAHLHALRLPRYFRSNWAGILYAPLLVWLRPEVVNLFFTWHGEEIAFRLLPKWGFALNLNLHYPAEQVPHRYHLLRRSRITSSATHIIAVSNYVAEGAMRWLGRRPTVIQNGVDLTTFSPAENKPIARQQLGIPDNTLVLTTVAALERRKGIHKVLEGLSQVVQEFPNMIYLVAGDGAERKNLTEQCGSLGLAKHVRFLGSVTDIVCVYQAADIFVFLSKGEASPLALLEAMACGLPVIAIREKPLDEFAAPLGTQFVDNADSDAVAQSILQLARNPLMLSTMGRESREHAEKHFDWEYVVDRYLCLFTEEVAK